MGILQIATVSENVAPILKGLDEFDVAKLILIFPTKYTNVVNRLQEELDRRKEAGDFDYELVSVKTDFLKMMLDLVSDIVRKESRRYDEVMINASSGEKLCACAAISAAFINGIKTVTHHGDRFVDLPILKFEYTEIINDDGVTLMHALAGDSPPGLSPDEDAIYQDGEAVMSDLEKNGGAGIAPGDPGEDAVTHVDDLETGDHTSTGLTLKDLALKSRLSETDVVGLIAGRKGRIGLEKLGMVRVDRSQKNDIRILLTDVGRVFLVGKKVGRTYCR